MTTITLPLQRLDVSKSKVLPILEHAYSALAAREGRENNFCAVGIKFDWDGVPKSAEEALLLQIDPVFELLTYGKLHQLTQVERLYVCGLAGSLKNIRDLMRAAMGAAFLRDDEEDDTSLMMMLRGGVLMLDWDPDPTGKIVSAVEKTDDRILRADHIGTHIKVLAYRDSSNHDCLSFSTEAARAIIALLQRDTGFRALPGTSDLKINICQTPGAST